MTAMAATGGSWAEKDHYPLWHRSLEQLYPATNPTGYPNCPALQRYPATLLLYALGLGAVDRNHLKFIKSLLEVKLHRIDNEELPAIWALSPDTLLPMSRPELHTPEGLKQSETPLNLWIHDALRHQTQNVLRKNSHFTRTFDKLAILLSLGSKTVSTSRGCDYALPGCFFWRGETRDPFLAEIKRSLEAHGDLSPYVRSGLCGSNASHCRNEIERLEQSIADTG